MSASYLDAPHLHDEAAAIAFVEAQVWPEGPVCPHCGNCEQDRIGRLSGKSTRQGTLKCYACRKPFTVKIGTIFEDSHVPMYKWLQAIFLVAASKKGISANQLHRTLGVTLKTAWFMGHRIRLAMGGSAQPMGGNGGAVEADETYFGRKPRKDKRAGHGHKETVFAVLDRQSKQVRSTHITGKTFAGIKRELNKVDENSVLMTDSYRLYRNIAKRFQAHEAVNHSKGEYVRGVAHTNTIEGYFSVFKRGMIGTYQHCKWTHLHRYLAEFDFRYNNREALEVDDAARTRALIQGVKGKRLTYETVSA